MKNIRKLLLAVCSLMLVCGMTLTARAAYKYKVKMIGGLHGSNQGVIYETEIGYDSADEEASRFNTADYTSAPDSEKYYFMGWQISGQEGLVGSLVIDEDTVFVAAYGVKGDMTEYTVKYVDEDGKEIEPSVTREGKVGDKPVAAYKYIEGYTPNAYNLTKTLTKAGPNEFTFEYVKNEVIVKETTIIEYDPKPNGSDKNKNSNKNSSNNSGKKGQTAPSTAVTAEIIDLDEVETQAVQPAVNNSNVKDSKTNTESSSGLVDAIRNNALLFGGGFAAIAAAVFVILKKIK